MLEQEQQGTGPTVFSRGSLKMTFDIIRKKNPQLALQIRNISAGTPLEKASDQTDNRNSDYFNVTLDSFQVRAVVETLLEEAQSLSLQPKDAGAMIVTKALVEDWVALANKMISELKS